MKYDNTSKEQILKSTGIVGGSKVITIIIGIIKTKIAAVLLGPSGIGLIGIYSSTIQTVNSLTGLGLDFSAVRDVAESTGDNKSISKTIIILKRWVWFTGFAGLIATLVLSKPISVFTFQDDSYSLEIAILSIVILFTTLSKGQIAALQGLRRINEMAKAGIYGTILSFFLAVPLYYFFGLKGIIPVLVINALAALFYSWWYARKIKFERISLSLTDTFHSGLRMVKLGLFYVIAGFTTSASMYGIKVFLSDKSGLESVGIFQSSWNISTMYIGLVLSAMAADYFPRLSRFSKDNSTLVVLVNEQKEVASILSLPLLIGMISFLPFIIQVFYSSKFDAAIKILDWQLVGLYFKIIAWPMSYVILAKAHGKTFILTEFIWNATFVGLIFLGWNYFKMEVLGIAFLFSYIIYGFMYYYLIKKSIGFTFTTKNKRIIIVNISLIVFAFIVLRYVPTPYKHVVGTILTVSSIWLTYIQLQRIINLDKYLLKFKNKFKRK